MRVVFNALASYRQRTGVGSYIANLLAELPGLAGSDEIAAFPSGWMAQVATVAGGLLKRRQPHHVQPKSVPLEDKTRFRWRGFLKQFGKGLCKHGFQLTCSRSEFDLYHEPNFIPWPSELPVVLTVHDLSVLLHPEWHPLDRVKQHENNFPRSLRESRHIITVSETVRQETIRHFGIAPDRITAVHNGVRSDMEPLPEAQVHEVLRRRGLPTKFVLYVGAVEPRKNLLTVMRAYCGLPSDVRSEYPLVLAGPWGWNYQKERAYYESVGRGRGILHLGYVADDELPALYNAARVLVYPSHYEGFGLPPVEMLACGGAVIASTAAALREVLGNRAEFVEPLDEAGWRLSLLRVLSDDEYRKRLSEGGSEYARRFSWRRSAEKTWHVYRQCIAVPRRRIAA